MKRGVLPKKKGRPPTNAGSVPYKVRIRDQAGSNEIRIPTWIASQLDIKPRTKGPDGSITGTKLEWSYKDSEKDSLTIKAGGAGTKYSYQKRGSIYAVVPMKLARQYGFMAGTWVEFTADIESRTVKITKTTPGKPPRLVKKDWFTASEAREEYKLQIKEADIRTEYHKSRVDYLEGRLSGDPNDLSQPAYWLLALSKYVKIDPKELDRILAGIFTTKWWTSVYFVFWAVDTYTGWTPAVKYYLCDILIPKYRVLSPASRNQGILKRYNEVVNHAQVWRIKPHQVAKILDQYTKHNKDLIIIDGYPPPRH